MATILSKLGSFNIDTSKTGGQTQTISGIDFQPKIVLFWWGTGYTASGDLVASGTVNFGFGAGIAQSYSRLALNGFFQNNISPSKTITSLYYNESIMLWRSNALNYGAVDFSGMTTSGFTLIYDAQIVEPALINYLALGGDDLTGTHIGYGTFPAGTGISPVTSYWMGLFPTPEVVIFVSDYYTSYNAYNNTARGSIGWATSSGNQANISYYDTGNANPTNSVSRAFNDDIATYVRAPAKDTTNRTQFVEFIPSGFNINQTISNTSKYSYVALKGGKYHVGGFSTASGIGNITETIGFEPKVIMFMSANTPLSSGMVDNISLSFGAYVASGHRSTVAVWDEDNVSPSEIAYAQFTDRAYTNIKHQTICGKFDITSTQSDGFTLAYEDINDNYVTYLAIGETPRSSKSAYVAGVISTNGSKSAYVYGHDPNGLEIHAYTYGAVTSSNLISAYVEGGVIPANTQKGVYVGGKDSITSSKSSYVYGSYAFNIFQLILSYYELAISISNKSAYVTGNVFVKSNISSFILGQIISSKSAFLEGYSPNESLKHAYTQGASLTTYGPSIWII